MSSFYITCCKIYLSAELFLAIYCVMRNQFGLHVVKKIVNLFAVLAEGPGWGCVSDYDEDIMNACSNTTLPANTTDISNVDSCRYVTVDHFKLQRDRICSCYIYNFIRQMAAVHATLQPVGL